MIDLDSKKMGSGTRRGRPPLDPHERRERILKVASGLFIQKGYSEVTLEEISREAAVTKRTIYDLIGNKEQLFHAVCNRGHKEIADVGIEYTATGGGLRDSLIRLGKAFVRYSCASETVALSRAIIAEHGRFPKLATKILHALMDGMANASSSTFKEMVRSGAIRPLDPEKSAALFFDVVVGNILFLRAMGLDAAIPDDEEIASRVDIYIKGYLSEFVSASIN